MKSLLTADALSARTIPVPAINSMTVTGIMVGMPAGIENDR